VGIIEVREWAFLVVHEGNEISGVGESFCLEDIEYVLKVFI